MKTLKWMTVLAIVFVTSINVSAQRKQHQQRQMPDSAQMEKRMEKMKTELNLSEKQAKQFETLLAEHKSEVKALHEKHKPQREKQKEEMDMVKVDFEKDVEKILTPEQKVAFDTLKKQGLEKHKNQKDCDCCRHGKGKGHGKGQGQGTNKE